MSSLGIIALVSSLGVSVWLLVVLSIGIPLWYGAVGSALVVAVAWLGVQE